ncbi:MAG: GvpL/GvpF family gas vesicle protein [Acidobacteriota bacterium]
MKHLLYCIFSANEYLLQKPLLGINQQPISIITNNGLSAATSKIIHSQPFLEISSLLTYKQVIESFHLDRTVIPMRYGAIFEDEIHIIQFLAEQSKHYQLLLTELDGCVEMGIRIIFPIELRSSDTNKVNLSSLYTIDRPGKAYLAVQQQNYTMKDYINLEQAAIVERISSILSDFYVRIRKECQVLANHRLLSLYFLIRRESICHFRKTFQQVVVKESLKLLLSGPWPPYNFVIPYPAQDILLPAKQQTVYSCNEE